MTEQQVAATPPRAVLRRLAEVHAEHDGVLSIYLDLDPSVVSTPLDQRTEIASLLDQASDAYVRKDLPHDEKNARTQAIERLRERLNGPGITKNKTRAMAIFVAPSADVFETLSIGHPVPPTMVVDETPYLRPLAGDAGPRTWAVLVLDKRRARLFYGGDRHLIEVESFEDNVPAHQKQGGWSAEHYQRHANEAAKEHIEKATETLFRFFEQTRFDALAIAAPEEAYNWTVDRMHAYLRDRFKGRINIEIDFPNAEDVLEAAAPLFTETREKAIEDLLHVLDEAPRGRVALGPAPVFEALFERRVDTLVVSDGYASPGVRCRQCGWLGVAGAKCPFDGVATEQSPDVIDDAIDLALQQAARVVSVDRDADRRPAQPICALLRY